MDQATAKMIHDHNMAEFLSDVLHVWTIPAQSKVAWEPSAILPKHTSMPYPVVESSYRAFLLRSPFCRAIILLRSILHFVIIKLNCIIC
ncbi:hypothetical protein N7494_009800 [Penicillium frequentans]|uniref:Uncharacterized protein n=1 Tax=Penicillium frequentans TaxID=3151616 RepID=A0AAD6CTG7_9EURO|nr:hypothetical protein N7494_009800 [Penicillium glabrum]